MFVFSVSASVVFLQINAAEKQISLWLFCYYGPRGI